MNKKQVFDVLQLLSASYPTFDVTQEKIDIWHRLLKDQNAAIVMRNAESYVLEYKFPPSISDLRERVHQAYKSNTLDQIEQWERDASGKC